MMIRNCLTLDCAFIFINSMILSHVSYGLTTWSQAHQSSVKTIECLYNRAWKVLDKKRIRYHRCQILSKYKILSLANFISLHFVKLVFKCLNNAAPTPLCKIITRQQSGTRSITRSALKGNCSIPVRRTSFAQTCLFNKRGKIMEFFARSLEMYPNNSHFQKNKQIVANSGTNIVLIFSFYTVFLVHFLCLFFFLFSLAYF